MKVQKNITSQPDVINYFKELPFYYTYIEKPHIKRLRNIDLLSKHLFLWRIDCHEKKTFKWYAMTCKVEILEKEDPLIQLEASKWSIKNLLDDLLKETTGFKYQVTIKILLKKYKLKEIEFSSVYFNSTTKAVINDKFDLDKSFQKILYRIENWINEGSGWIIATVHSQYTNISSFRPLLVTSYIKLLVELKNLKKDWSKLKRAIKNVFFGVILDILIQWKYIMKKLYRKIKSLLIL